MATATQKTLGPRQAARRPGDTPGPDTPRRLSTLVAKVRSVIRGDKYMVGAYPTGGPPTAPEPHRPGAGEAEPASPVALPLTGR